MRTAVRGFTSRWSDSDADEVLLVRRLGHTERNRWFLVLGWVPPHRGQASRAAQLGLPSAIGTSNNARNSQSRTSADGAGRTQFALFGHRGRRRPKVALPAQNGGSRASAGYRPPDACRSSGRIATRFVLLRLGREVKVQRSAGIPQMDGLAPGRRRPQPRWLSLRVLA